MDPTNENGNPSDSPPSSGNICLVIDGKKYHAKGNFRMDPGGNSIVGQLAYAEFMPSDAHLLSSLDEVEIPGLPFYFKIPDGRAVLVSRAEDINLELAEDPGD